MTYQDVIHDASLALFLPVQRMPTYALGHVVGAAPVEEDSLDRSVWQIQQAATSRLYERLKNLSLPDGRKWGDLAPPGDPVTNWEEWQREAAIFFAYLPAVFLERAGMKDDGPEWDDFLRPAVERDAVADAFYDWAKESTLCSDYNDEWDYLLTNWRSQYKPTDKRHDYTDEVQPSEAPKEGDRMTLVYRQGAWRPE